MGELTEEKLLEAKSNEASDSEPCTEKASTQGTKRSISGVEKLATATSKTTGSEDTKKRKKSKFSSLSLGLVSDSPPSPSATSTSTFSKKPVDGPYKPLLFRELPPLPTIISDQSDMAADSSARLPSSTNDMSLSSQPSPKQSEIRSLATEAGLDDQALNVLQGRHRRGGPIKIVDYSVDDQYTSNKAYIDSGVGSTSQPVRAISSGKHQLRSLINSAVQQQESLEESFATGRRNKKASGAKYGF
ncbi:mitotic checkpoint regulator, MAD2B-interacting-domain-containing protein [Lipomyces oligophaga]|uniref:mitotic checkpoint regulator, MAD2B-interacting-domain-containing protein n=1 Tax=Lipomyces oligophaga TaxID=45792 RepID=UPI0034D01264